MLRPMAQLLILALQRAPRRTLYPPRASSTGLVEDEMGGAGPAARGSRGPVSSGSCWRRVDLERGALGWTYRKLLEPYLRGADRVVLIE
jgi:hypothetical protein